MFSIATWNVNSLRVRLPHVLDWLEVAKPDVLAIQETKTVNENFPLEEIQAAGYQAVFAGQKTYNGVALLSKQEARDVEFDFPGFTDPQRRVLAATVNGVRILNLYVPNGSSVDSDKYQYKLEWLENCHKFVEQQLSDYPEFVILGDFNIAPADLDVHDPELWRDKVLVSKPERKAFFDLCDLGFEDTFRLFSTEQVFSWWDYRQAAFRRNLGLRIDHILSSKPIAQKCKACVVDKDPRKWERPSDHAPVIAQYEL